MNYDGSGNLHPLIGRPRFPLALQAYRQAMIEAFRSCPTLHQYVSGSQRFYLHSLAFHLHITRDPWDETDGLTLKTLRAACTRLRVASPGMAQLYLQMLYRNRLLVDEPISDRRFRRFGPSERMIVQIREQTRANLAPVDILFPEINALDHLDNDPGYLFAFRRMIGNVMFSQGNPVRQISDVNYFSERAAGHMLLLELMDATTDAGQLPTARAAKIDFDVCASRYAVSRMHVSKVFAGAERLGLVYRVRPGNAIEPSERLIASYLNWAAIQFRFFSVFAAKAASERAKGVPVA